IERERERLRAEYEREVSEIRRQYEVERVTKEDLQRKYDDLRLQYDGELDALNATRPKDENVQPSPVGNERSKTKKKGGILKQKRNGEVVTNGQDIADGDSTSVPVDDMEQQQKIERLQELEHKLIGGEEANNEERKKKRKKKLNEMREKLEQRKRLSKAINADDDDTLLKVFDNAQEELHFTAKKLEHEKVENKRLQNDNEDLQHEFQREREGYLNIIREQEKRLLLYRTMIDKMSSIMQRSCNYSNIDRIIEQARYEEDKNQYILPEPTIEEIQLPQVGNLPITTTTTTNGRIPQSDYITPTKTGSTPLTTEYEDDFIESTPVSNGYQNQYSTMNTEESERRYGRYDTTNLPAEKTRIKRQEHLLNESSILQRTKRPLQMNNNDNDYMNRRLNPFEPPARLSRKYGFSSDKQ
ncbi:unnamed protein product, partial [Rotaria sp. Silwood2]